MVRFKLEVGVVEGSKAGGLVAHDRKPTKLNQKKSTTVDMILTSSRDFVRAGHN